jgi:hypothetical protein
METVSKHNPIRGHGKLLLLSLLAALALAALTASAASASLPEWGGCEATPTGHGKYSDPACTVVAKGAAKKTEGDYEWYTGADFGWVNNREHQLDHPKQLSHYKLGEFYEPVIGPTTFETPAGKKMECTGGSIWFKLENAETKGVQEVWVHLEGCQSEGYPCESALEGLGEVTNENQWYEGEGLKGTLGFISGKGTSEPVVGLSLTAFEPKSEKIEQKRLLFADCSGGIGPLWVGGEKKHDAVISLIGPVNQMVGEGEPHEAFAIALNQTAGVQEVNGFEGKKPVGLDGNLENHFEPLGWGASFNLAPEGGSPPIEIKATP